MTDPRDFDRSWDAERRIEMERRAGTPTAWGWIAGAVFIIVILVLVFTSGQSTRTTREDTNAPATTGMATKTAPPAVPVQPHPGEAPSNTGQSGQ